MGQTCQSNFGASSNVIITLGALASSLAGVGRQSTMLSNIASSEGAQSVRIYFSITAGPSAVATPILPGSTITFYLLQGDANVPTIVTDGAGTTDAALTINTAPLIYTIQVAPNSVNTQYSASFIIKNPGPYWGIAVVNSTGVALATQAVTNPVKYVYESIATLF